jgi:hypothetical protein
MACESKYRGYFHVVPVVCGVRLRFARLFLMPHRSRIPELTTFVVFLSYTLFAKEALTVSKVRAMSRFRAVALLLARPLPRWLCLGPCPNR